MLDYKDDNMKKLKVAITSQYYESSNYGGNLQSFAMCKGVEKCGFIGEQLCFPVLTSQLTTSYKKQNKLSVKKIEIRVKVFIYKMLICNRQISAWKNEKCRKKTVLTFNKDVIPHSSFVYCIDDVKQSMKDYSVFITGSDLVWNPNSFNWIFTLNFVPDNIPKFSYAPSMGVTSLIEHEQEVYRSFLQGYQAVSVRESNAVPILEKLSPVPVEWVLDPTLLLEQEDWNEICTERMVKEPYLFCYFLGSNPISRHLAEKYAKKHGLKLVTIPYLLGKYRGCDYKFGDIQLSAVSPADFISLIRYSDCVFTDSFHACVFSFLYQREFYAFRRDQWEKPGLGTRITSFLEMLECASRYCETDDKENMEYIESQSPIDYNSPFPAFERMKEKSWDYLKSNLKLAEERVRQNEKH